MGARRPFLSCYGLYSGSHLVKFMISKGFSVGRYQDFLSNFLCENPKKECYCGKCESCPADKRISKKIFDVFMKHNVHEIGYKQWVTKPKATLEKKRFRPKILSMICARQKNYCYIILLLKRNKLLFTKMLKGI